MRQLLLAIGFVGGGLLSASAIAAGGVQCWTDNQGQRACGDSVPPQYARQQREVFDSQGRVRQVKPREKTEAEVAAEEKAKREADALALKQQKQRDYDRFLLSTYNSEKEIEHARDERITMLDGRQRLVAKSVADNQKAIDQQQRLIDNLTKAGKKPGVALTRKLDELKQTLTDNKAALANYAAEKQQVTDKYNADLARYRELNAEPDKP